MKNQFANDTGKSDNYLINENGKHIYLESNQRKEILVAEMQEACMTNCTFRRKE